MVCLQLQDGLGDDPLGSELSRLTAGLTESQITLFPLG